jgi:hypothetical protein
MNYKNFVGVMVITSIALFMACQNQDNKNADSQESIESEPDYKTLGAEITGMAFASLSSNLMRAIEESGVEGAIDFCHIAALPLTDSVGINHQVSIKRVASKYRNPSNAPDGWESELLEYYAQLDKKDLSQDSLITLPNGEKVYTKPIILQGACIQCHGEIGKDIDLANYRAILKKYPEDKAVGFSPGDLRGMWVVRF